MRLARRTFLASMAVSLFSPPVLRYARADAPVTLKLHHYFSAVSCGHAKFLAPWARKVEADSGDRIRIEIFPSMQLGGAPAQLLDQVRDGAADIVWAAPSSTPERFFKIEAFELPFVLSRRALVNSRALEEFAAVFLRDEFRDFHPICFSCRDHGVVHAARAIKSIEDLKGLRLHVPNRLAAEAVQALGARGMTIPTPQVPMALAGHVIDGCLDPWDVVPSLKLGDVLKNHTDFGSSALSTATFVLAMNKPTYDRLPRELKLAIDNNAGQFAAAMAGAMWDVEAKTVADAARDRGEPITVLTADEVAHWRKATEPVVAAWQKQMKERKIDGGRLIASVRSLVAKYADEPEPQPQAPQPSPAAEQKPIVQPPAAAQSKAEFMRPKADAPAAVAPTPIAKPASKALDIPL
jgi:TRAP-type C4-dicarboxylate transport system substrate-binding protein